MEFIEYTTIDSEYRPGEQVDIEADCNEVMFINAGASSLKVGNVPLAAGASYTIGGNLGEINKRLSYKILFSSTAATEYLVVVRKIYLNRKR